jgi:hypothetical protein
MVDHTKTPWSNACFQVYGSDKTRIAHTGMGQLPPYRSSESEANAVFIVKAANAHDDLVEYVRSSASAGCATAQSLLEKHDLSLTN